MIYYNSDKINDWNFGDDNIIKVYRNNAVCYYKVVSSGGTTSQTPCYAVVDDISQYSDTEFEDVFNKADGKWYKLNNLNEYEEYGIYGSGRTITTYEGKLTIDDGYEYIYSGSSWVNVGEVSGSTATLPNVPFVFNYNAKNYNASTHTIAKTIGQLSNTDAVGYNYPTNIEDHSDDGYITISNSSMRIRLENQDISLFNRTNTSTGASMTIVCKAMTTEGENIITNRDGNYNWMYRQSPTRLRFHGSSLVGEINCSSTNPSILSVRTSYDNGVNIYYNNWSNGTSSSSQSFSYGSTNSDSSKAGALFVGYGWNNTNEQWKGDFYWVYMSQNTLTDEQIQQVIAYNEEGGGQPIYPLYYDEIQDPPSSVSFSSMTEAEEYECPYVGLDATIGDTDYIFDENYDWVTKYALFEVSGEYLCDGGDKYKKMEEKVRNVDNTWSSQDPPVYEKGELIESGSTDCSCRLPEGYTEVEYIENTTADIHQYSVSAFTVPFVGVYGDKPTIKLSLNSSQNGQNRYIAMFGSELGHCLRQDSGYGYNLNCEYGGKNNYVRGNFTMVYDVPLEYKVYPSGLTITNTSTSDVSKINFTNGTANPSTTTTEIGIFGISFNDGGSYIALSKFYSLVIEDANGSTKYNYIPCKRESDGEYGVYDIVNQQFYYSQYLSITGGDVVCTS